MDKMHDKTINDKTNAKEHFVFTSFNVSIITCYSYNDSYFEEV